jgi:CRISPR-associated endonuclease Cas1
LEFHVVSLGRLTPAIARARDDSHVKTRIAQYQAITNGKSDYIAKQIVKSKIQGQNKVLEKYGLRMIECNVDDVSDRNKLFTLESRCARMYFKQIFALFPESIRPEKRVGFKAYDGLNNVFNFGYNVLRCRIYKALLKAKLEPYLGFLHSTQHGKPSLVCDFQELYRYLIDDFLIGRCRKLRKQDFVLVTDFMMRLKMGKRIHLCEYETNDLAEGLNTLFDREVMIPRMRYGSKQTLDTLINEEALLFAKFLRSEKQTWIPRIARAIGDIPRSQNY